MTLTLELPPEVENQLQVGAARSGQDLQTFAMSLLAQASSKANGLAVAGENGPQLTAEEIDSALDELAAIGADLPPSADPDIFSRANIYADHD